ncbi:hypothetical protein M436DRAFT_86586 [Aureobasidium namibiae CBS 147.97]|uniref:Uncharacterized protein n=1 Tax=Aureobasidium namibiae CBS 147.97 TaxID=1043004 RepID=A0A074X0R7_9PEZI
MAPTKITFSSENIPGEKALCLNHKGLSQAHITVTELGDESQSDSELSTSSTSVPSPPGVHAFGAEAEYFCLSFEVLNVLEQYGTHVGHQATTTDGSLAMWSGKLRFLPHVYHHISRSTPVQLTMPAFPCKSSNRENKVLGHLPDLGEEFALCRLNAMAEDVAKVYKQALGNSLSCNVTVFMFLDKEEAGHPGRNPNMQSEESKADCTADQCKRPGV